MFSERERPIKYCRFESFKFYHRGSENVPVPENDNNYSEFYSNVKHILKFSL